MSEAGKHDNWEFWIDAGGTFTDCLARDPNGDIAVYKVLSSGAVRGHVERIEAEAIADLRLRRYPDRFFDNYNLRLEAHPERAYLVKRFRAAEGVLEVDWDGTTPASEGDVFTLSSGEPAPILAIRLGLGLRLDEPIGAVSVRLGTTRATNALLERKGAPTAFVTTAGFGDILRIGNQDRPRLFDLEVRKPKPLFAESMEVEERIDAKGKVLDVPSREKIHDQLAVLRENGIDALAVCLLHAWRNPEHERLVLEEAEALGFTHVSLSSNVSPTIRIVPRGDTTVADAYLTPVLHDYIRQVKEAMPEAGLRMMTSAGGLVRPENTQGKDMILSGPAGGVVGFAAAARDAGFPRSIGFDMGGTSTDVSRFDGEFVYEYETQKAGVRVVAPMLAIETVAAGGGSICHFDGQQLLVGPESAGAAPGPACYGAGGPLTVTDINLYLGRILPDRFPFVINRDTVAELLENLCSHIEETTGRSYTPVELAEGFLRIANANMVAAIQRISIAKGCDPREYCLVSFGGAGGQHACAVAEQLGITHVLLHPFAGVLSAYGMGMADTRKFAVRTVLATLSEGADGELSSAFEEMTRELEAEMESENLAAGAPRSVRRLYDLRYRGQGSTITVAEEEGGDLVKQFEAEHKALYGYTFRNRGIEVVNVRMEMTVAGARFSPGEKPEEPYYPQPEGHEEAVFAGGRIDTPVFARESLRPGARLRGPALVAEATSVTVLHPGWEARLTGRGDLLLTKKAADAAPKVEESNATIGPPDPILLQLFTSRFTAIADQMGTTLQRTALSVNVKERLDFSCAIFSPKGELVVNAPHMPVHLGAMAETVRCLLEEEKEMAPGDVFLTNDPTRGGSHLPDITAVTPVFDDETHELLFFTASRAHHAEVGGKRPGSMPPDSRNLAEEGVVISRFRIVAGGMERFDEFRRLLTDAPFPSRAPEDNIADIGAQVAANHAGAQKLLELSAAYGIPTVQRYMASIQDMAETKMRAALRVLPDGTHRFEDRMDSGACIRAAIDVRGDEATIDFTGTSAVQSDNFNANRAIVTAAVLYCFRCLIGEDIPLNQGVLNPIRVILPECFLNPPRHGDPREAAAVAAGNVETSQRCVDVLFGALKSVAASQGTMNNLTFGNDSFGYYETICGGTGAGPDFDGEDAVHTHMTNTRLTDPEVLEAQYPVRLHRFEIRRGSGGGGSQRGGDGTRREIEFLEPVELSMITQRRLTAPYGLEGGEPGTPGRNILVRAGEIIAMPFAFSEKVRPGDRLIVETPGGGGYGRKSV